MSSPVPSSLYELAASYGIQTSYYDLLGRLQTAQVEPLLAILRGLRSPVSKLDDVPSALRERRQDLWRRWLEPVVAVRERSPIAVDARLPLREAEGTLNAYARLDDGSELRWSWKGSTLPILETATVENTAYVRKQLLLFPEMPPGYHRLTLEAEGKSAGTLLIVAPAKGYSLAQVLGGSGWGAFLPLYALNRAKAGGTGDYSLLGDLVRWAAGKGGKAVATLPLLPAFLEKPFDPSPYMPVSRLLWNEFYLDLNGIPELAICPEGKAELGSPLFQSELESLQKMPLVDYGREMLLKKRVLEGMARCHFSSSSVDRMEDFNLFAATHPVVTDYARFRATMDRQGVPWRQWPATLRGGVLADGDCDQASRLYHLYVQWLAHEQVAKLCGEAGRMGVVLNLDLPLGVHPDGYDAWRWQSLFASGVTAGAPPDVVFTRGQDWVFAPPVPDQVRQQGYSYFISCLRHHLQRARVLRIDHVMQFHRLFWIPQGATPADGVYVRYPADEFYAILALESQRHRAAIAGEDLGMVPPEVRPAMAHYGLQRTYVVQFELESSPERALHAVPAEATASLNTHDMFPFAAFWEGLDILDQAKAGLLDEASLKSAMERREKTKADLLGFLSTRGMLAPAQSDIAGVLRAMLLALGASQAGLLLVNLEDLWQEKEPHNRPGTLDERNWRRKARHTFDDFCQLPVVNETLGAVNHSRKEAKAS